MDLISDLLIPALSHQEGVFNQFRRPRGKSQAGVKKINLARFLNSRPGNHLKAVQAFHVVRPAYPLRGAGGEMGRRFISYQSVIARPDPLCMYTHALLGARPRINHSKILSNDASIVD